MSPTGFFLVALLATYASAGVSPRSRSGAVSLPSTRATKVCNEANELATRCSDNCQSVELCQYKDDVLDWQLYRTCPTGQLCAGNNGVETCVVEGDSVCPSLTGKITCVKEGVYPHPFDCQKYYDCKGKDDNPEYESCKNSSFMFSACTGKCDWPFNAEYCAQAEFDCSMLGYLASEPVYSNHRFFFTCRVDVNGTYFPEYDQCLEGKTFDERTHECENHAGPGCGIAK